MRRNPGPIAAKLGNYLRLGEPETAILEEMAGGKERKYAPRTDIVREGEQKSRDEKCGGAANNAQKTSGLGAALNSPWAVGVGAAGIGILTVWVLCKGDDPISPSTPNHGPCPIP